MLKERPGVQEDSVIYDLIVTAIFITKIADIKLSINRVGLGCVHSTVIYELTVSGLEPCTQSAALGLFTGQLCLIMIPGLCKMLFVFNRVFFERIVGGASQEWQLCYEPNSDGVTSAHLP